MIVEFFSNLGPWTWMIVGILLLIGEAILPGVFLFWFGLAGVVIGALTLAPFTDVSWWPWQAQMVGFGVLSLIFIMVGNKVFPSNTKDDAASAINDPHARYLGTETVLLEAIKNGTGRVRLGDTTWLVKGPPLNEGSKVRIVGSDSGVLVVEEN